MSRFKRIFRVPIIRICSLIAAVAVTAGSAGAYGYYLARSYETDFRNAYLRALDTLDDYLDRFNIKLDAGAQDYTPKR